MEFRPLASGSRGNAYLCSAEGQQLLIEAGIRPARLRRLLGYRLAVLQGALISHAHGDHLNLSAAGALLRSGVGLYGTCLGPSVIGAPHPALHRVPMLEFAYIGAFRVMPFPAVHDSPDACGFIVDAAGARLLYLTDSAFMPFRFAGIDILAVECNFSEEILRDRRAQGKIDDAYFWRVMRNHMSLERLCHMLQADREIMGNLREIHLLHLSDGNSDEVLFKREVERVAGVPVYVAAAREEVRA